MVARFVTVVRRGRETLVLPLLTAVLVVLLATPGCTRRGRGDPNLGPGSYPKQVAWLAIPNHIKVMPLFFVPRGEGGPTADQKARFMRHMLWAQRRYHELLSGRDTFQLATEQPQVYQGKHTLQSYQERARRDAPEFTAELLNHYGVTRFTCPYIFVFIVMNPRSDYPTGGGRPLNGGFNTGGGLVGLSSHSLDKSANFQSTLQHELGHAFGLPHVDVYLYDMENNPSIMSYNPRHHTRGFEPAPVPGILIPEDIRGLALNKRVFPRLVFIPARDLPRGYRIAGKIIWLAPMEIPRQVPNVVRARTQSGEAHGSSVGHIVQGWIRPSVGPGINFDASCMWHSGRTASGEVWAEVIFPVPVTLTKVGVHSQHSGAHHGAEAVTVHAWLNGEFEVVVDEGLDGPDDYVSFDPTTAQRWAFVFEAGESGHVVIRGLQFFYEGLELFSPLVPWGPVHRPARR